MNVHVLEVRNTVTQTDWKLVSVYSNQDTAHRALKAMYKNIYKEDQGCEMRVVERMVHP